MRRAGHPAGERAAHEEPLLVVLAQATIFGYTNFQLVSTYGADTYE